MTLWCSCRRSHIPWTLQCPCVRSTPSRTLRAQSGRCSSTQSTFWTCTASGVPRAWISVWALAWWWPAWRWNFAPMYTYMGSGPLTNTRYYSSPSTTTTMTTYRVRRMFMQCLPSLTICWGYMSRVYWKYTWGSVGRPAGRQPCNFSKMSICVLTTVRHDVCFCLFVLCLHKLQLNNKLNWECTVLNMHCLHWGCHAKWAFCLLALCIIYIFFKLQLHSYFFLELRLFRFRFGKWATCTKCRFLNWTFYEYLNNANWSIT